RCRQTEQRRHEAQRDRCCDKQFDQREPLLSSAYTGRGPGGGQVVQVPRSSPGELAGRGALLVRSVTTRAALPSRPPASGVSSSPSRYHETTTVIAIVSSDADGSGSIHQRRVYARPPADAVASSLSPKESRYSTD
ncbi:MAG: hypothetical protein V3T48_10310, partial [Vicinamibacterales bacterium]